MELPVFWKSTLEDIDRELSLVQKGSVSESRSAGGRPIYTLTYGHPNRLCRTANYSSAAGARDLGCYADKTQPHIRPCLFLVGGIHGGEPEGIMAILNLIRLLETGTDLAGTPQPELTALAEKVNLVLIPCANPDGRARFPFSSALDMPLDTFRYYAQGTWKDGSLCNWPDCKKVHPIREASARLGAYYNDDGINMMHDRFCSPMAVETALLLEIAEAFAPDLTLLLHGCADAKNELLPPRSVHRIFREEIYGLGASLKQACNVNSLDIALAPPCSDGEEPLHSYNLVSAITHTCGEACAVYECNQGLPGKHRLSPGQIYDHHLLLFEEACRFAIKKRNAHLQKG